MTPEVISKLEEVFAIGGSDKEACFYADISHQALYDYQNKHPEFTERKEALKERPILLARQTVVKKIGESYQNAIDYLKRKKRSEFGDNTDITSGGEKLPTPIMPLSNAIPTDDSNKEDNPAI
jgi:hypothetical protein